MKDVLKVPESFFMPFDTMIAFDHFFQVIKVITCPRVPEDLEDSGKAYEEAKTDLQRMVNILKSKDIPMPEQGPIQLNQEYTSNIGQSRYEGHVRRLKEHIINAPSFRLFLRSDFLGQRYCTHLTSTVIYEISTHRHICFSWTA